MLGASVSGDLGLPPRSHGDPVMSTTQTFCHQHAQESQANLNTSITKKKSLAKAAFAHLHPKREKTAPKCARVCKAPQTQGSGMLSSDLLYQKVSLQTRTSAARPPAPSLPWAKERLPGRFLLAWIKLNFKFCKASVTAK